MGLLLLLLFVVAPLVELYVIIQVAQVIGGWETIAVVVLVGALGAWLIKRQGLAALARVSEALAQGRMPTKELLDGFLILAAGSLMLAPGFLTDVLAYLVLIPPTRALVRAWLLRRFRAGRYGAVFATTAGPRFVGTFRAANVHDTSGRDTGPDRPPLDP